ncbi:helix-turn-helix domain-containing protein [Rhizobium leguminosarum]|nr:helix-turn-helix domain-containing protein [Rhizobium leguminosarum]
MSPLGPLIRPCDPLCRAARALLDWTQRDLAERTSMSAVSIRAFEKGGDMRESNLSASNAHLRGRRNHLQGKLQ